MRKRPGCNTAGHRSGTPPAQPSQRTRARNDAYARDCPARHGYTACRNNDADQLLLCPIISWRQLPLPTCLHTPRHCARMSRPLQRTPPPCPLPPCPPMLPLTQTLCARVRTTQRYAFRYSYTLPPAPPMLPLTQTLCARWRATPTASSSATSRRAARGGRRPWPPCPSSTRETGRDSTPRRCACVRPRVQV